uniref:Holliday junction resolvase RuvC n=1 Tax=viral metagenome TaxID=1070528 RepID=A0A6M3J3J4_9ZZZZ
MKILAIDPGQTTGVLLMDTHTGSTLGAELRLWERLDALIQRTKPDVIVYEAFRLYPHLAKAQIGKSFPTVQVIGVIKYLANQACIPTVEQTAAMRKHVPKRPGITSPHVQSAYQHAETYRRRKEGHL